MRHRSVLFWVIASLLAVFLLLIVALRAVGLIDSITVHVDDEEGKPLPWTMVTFQFEYLGPSSWYCTSRFTGPLGDASAWGFGVPGFYIDKPGYYRSSGQITDVDFRSTVLKKIEHPKPMYADYADLFFPNDRQPHAYDLTAGDWLPPLGHGQTPDFIFQFLADDSVPVVKPYRDLDLKLTFSRPDDGIQGFTVDHLGSDLRLPKTAPESEYQSHWDWREVYPTRSQADRASLPNQPDRAYFFRVRSGRDENGKLTALYGKISHDLNFGPGRHNEIEIQIHCYYLNPDGTRTMEFDLKKNLAMGPSAIRVREP